MAGVRSWALALALVGACAAGAEAGAPAPYADVHVHYNWNQAETLGPEEAVARLRAAGAVLAVAASSPPELALRLADAGRGWVLALWSPYIDPVRRHAWHRVPGVLEAARAALASGRYAGIGEVHVVSGLGPRRDDPVLEGLLSLAARRGVPFLIHTEASDYRYFLPLCRKWSRVRFLWAHAGGILPPAQVARLLEACPNVWAELSARDPWHYGGLVGPDGALRPGWRRVLLRFPDRFMIGSDPVYPGYQIHHWDRPDTGWDLLARIMRFHRRWLRGLPAEVARRVRLANALAFFGVEGRAP